VLESAIGLGFADNLIFTEAIKVFEYLNTWRFEGLNRRCIAILIYIYIYIALLTHSQTFKLSNFRIFEQGLKKRKNWKAAIHTPMHTQTYIYI
jgi:hypothetical protein